MDYRNQHGCNMLWRFNYSSHAARNVYFPVGLLMTAYKSMHAIAFENPYAN